MRMNYRTVAGGGEAELVIEKSQFIGYAAPADTEEAALEFIQTIRKKHRDATHNVPAYVLGENNAIQRFSDDGEPSGTAGVPMLEVLKKEDVRDVVLVVTRYFGGVLLGTGGLVRAYSGAVQAGLAASTVIEKHHGISLQVTTDYTGIGKIQYIAGERSLPILDSEYTDKVVLKLLVPDDQIEEVKKAITEGTNGRAGLEKDAELYFAKVNGEVKTFEK